MLNWIFRNTQLTSCYRRTSTHNYGTNGESNLDLQGLNPERIMDKIILAAGQFGPCVILDGHRQVVEAADEEGN
jgi:hypothetical protein